MSPVSPVVYTEESARLPFNYQTLRMSLIGGAPWSSGFIRQ